MDQDLPAQPRVLIVDDEYLFARSLATDMQALGFDICDIAANRQDAFLQAMEDAPDIVLMDVNLEGGREGIEAARWLREECDIPIVFITAYTDPDTVKRASPHAVTNTIGTPQTSLSHRAISMPSRPPSRQTSTRATSG